MKSISNYSIDETIYENRHMTLYRGHAPHIPQPVVIKVFKAHAPTSSEIARFKKEYQEIKRLEIDGVVKIHDLIVENGLFAIVEEVQSGIPLKEWLRSRPFDLKRFLQIAMNIARIIGEIHKHNIVHLDIKPDTIIVDEAGEKVMVTDFGISAMLTHVNEELYHPDVIYGALRYMSPEKTGRMNRSVDYRTDIYSLGITLYEMAAGEAPFKADDPMEIIHAHIARTPLPPVERNPALPPVVSRMIQKLLAKTPEERYQNCFGLFSDLKVCLDQLNDRGRVEDFPIAKKDFSIKFSIPPILVGRDKELQKLLSAFEDAKEMSGGEIMLLMGRPGIGKSVLINEIHKPIVARKGYFLLGKFDQFKKEVPYSAIIQAFQGLIRQILTESESRLYGWRADLTAALGANAAVISSVIPELELILGPQPPAPELTPEESQNRFNLVFQSFINAFSTQGRHLAMFIDDLQWADMASLKLIKTIMTGYETRLLFFIGAYRDNEVQEHHPLSITLREILKAGRKISTIQLTPLDREHVNRIIMNSLQCEAHESEELATLVHRKTGGNPFFVNQFLKNLYDNKYIDLDERGRWAWDMSRIEQMQVTDNVVELLADRIAKLPSNTRHILQVCACVGNRFDLEALSVILEKSIDTTLSDLTEAIQNDMVRQFGDIYKFHHDRIQEAAYSLIPPGERAQWHYKIGRTVLNNTEPEQLNEKIFYIVDHLNRGLLVIVDKSEKKRVAELNLLAAKKAKNSNAYASALSYSKTGIGLLPEDRWQSCYDLSYPLYMEQLTCEYLTLNFDSAVEIFYDIVKHSNNNIHKARAYTLMIILYTNQGNYDEAMRLGLEGCKLIGFAIPLKVSKLSIISSLIKLYFRMGRRKIEDFADLPVATDEEFLAYDDMQIQTGTVGYYINANLFCYIVIYGVRQILTFGNSYHSPLAYCALGSIIGTGLNLYDAAYRFGQVALKIDEKIVGLSSSSKIKFMYTMFIQHWKKHAKHDLNLYRDSYKIGVERGDLIYSSHSINMLAVTRIMIGDNLDDILEEYEKYRNFQFGNKDPFMARRFMDNVQLCKCLKGVTHGRGSLNSIDYNEEEQLSFYQRENNNLGMYYYYLTKIRVSYFFGKYRECETPAKELYRLTKEKIATGSIYVPEANFYASLAMAALYLYVPGEKKQAHIAFIKRNQKQMKAWAKTCPDNFFHKYRIIEAELARCMGKHEKAKAFYLEAIRSAHANGYLQNEGIAYERAALLEQELGRVETARQYMKQAKSCYKTYGASEKVAFLEEEYPTLFLDLSSPSGASEQLRKKSLSAAAPSAGTDVLDLSTVIKSSQSLSGEVELSHLLEKIMTLSIENAGAQRGCLLLKNEEDNQLYIEAMGEVDEPIQVLNALPLEGNTSLAISIVNYVTITSQDIVLSDASSDNRFVNDPYIQKKRPKSILCAPIVHKGKSAGVIYLENNSLSNAFIPARLEILRILAAQAAISIENTRLISHRENAAKLQTEMKIAANIQTVLLPENPSISGFDISAYMKPADEVGGDYYDVINTPVKEWVVIGDVSGHGVPAGLIMMMVQTAIQTVVRNDPGVTPSRLLHKVNRSIKHNIIQMKEDKYMSITALSFEKEGAILFSGLHQNLLIYRAQKEAVEVVESAGIWLSPWDMGEVHGDKSLSLDKDDALLRYTDGVTEAKKGDSEMFSEERLIDILKGSRGASAREIRDRVLASLSFFQVHDDITMIILKKQ